MQPTQQPQVRKLEDIIATTNSAYDPLRQNLKKQRSQVGVDAQAARKSIDAQRTRSFRDVEQRAVNKGMFFSGAPTQEQMELDALEFNPAFANLESAVLQGQRSIDNEIFNINRQQQSEALGIQGQDQKRLADFINEQQKLDLERQQFQQRMSLERQKAASSRTSNRGAGYKVYSREDGSGFDFRNANGAPVSMAEYAEATGADLKSLLKNSRSAYDQAAYNDIVAIQNNGYSNEDAIAFLQRKYKLLF